MLKTPDMQAFYEACGYHQTDKGLGSNLKENADRLDQDQARGLQNIASQRSL